MNMSELLDTLSQKTGDSWQQSIREMNQGVNETVRKGLKQVFTKILNSEVRAEAILEGESPSPEEKEKIDYVIQVLNEMSLHGHINLLDVKY